jgi:hypothetical protein
MTTPTQAKPQPELPLFCIRRENVNVQWLVGLLKERGWMTRKDILREAQMKVTAHNERWVRALVEAAGDEIVKGQKGFNHISRCPLNEITHAANQAIAQGKLMIKYGLRLRKRAHEVMERQ